MSRPPTCILENSHRGSLVADSNRFAPFLLLAAHRGGKRCGTRSRLLAGIFSFFSFFVFLPQHLPPAPQPPPAPPAATAAAAVPPPLAPPPPPPSAASASSSSSFSISRQQPATPRQPPAGRHRCLRPPPHPTGSWKFKFWNSTHPDRRRDIKGFEGPAVLNLVQSFANARW